MIALFMLSTLGFLAFIVIGLISLIRKSEKTKRNFMIAGACFVVMIISFIAVPVPEAEEASADPQEEVTESETEEEPEAIKEKINFELISATYNPSDNTLVVNGKTNLHDGVEVGVGLKGADEYAVPAIPGFGLVENGEFTATLTNDTPIINGNYAIEASFGSFNNEKVNEVYKSYDEFIEAYTIKGDVEETDIGFNVNGIPLGSVDITEGITKEQLEQQKLAEKKANAQTIDYPQLKKNPDRYAGEFVKYSGEIIQIMEGNNITNIRLAVTPTSYGYDINDIIFIEYAGYTDFVDGDNVTVYGEIHGSYTYTSQAGFNITLPGLVATEIE